MNENNENECKWIILIELDKETMLDKNITMDDVNFAIKHYHQEDIKCVYSDYNDDNLVLRIRPNILNKKKIKSESLDQMDDIYLIKAFQDQLLQNIILRGTKKIKKVILRKLVNNIRIENNEFLNESIFVTSKALSGIQFRANNIESLDNLEKNSVDFYASVKSLYLQDRENKIENQKRGNIEVIYKNEEDWEEIDSQ